MARIRTIKPDFWTDEKVVDLDYAERLLFIGMWNFADDQGYLDYSLRRIKMQVFPADDIDVSRALQRIHALGLIRLYESPEGVVIHIVNWEKHQRVSNPSRARFTEGDLQECDWPTDALASPREPSIRKGREGKGSISPSSAAASEAEPDPFDEFWKHYPRKVEKQDARKAWNAALKKTTASEIIDAVKEYPFGDDPQFIKHAATWLNKGCWADAPDNVRPIRPAAPQQPDGPNRRGDKVRCVQIKETGAWRQVYDDEVLYGIHTEWRSVDDL